MEVIEVDSKYYSQVFSKPSHAFNSADFSAVNSYKCDQVYYLLFKDSKVRLGIIFGQRALKLYSPFSAPFGGFEVLYEDIKIQQIDQALEALRQWATLKKFNGIKIVPPPIFYNTNFLNKSYNALVRAGFSPNIIELNYQFPIHKFDEHYISNIWYNARKNLRIALDSQLVFEKLNNNGKLAYDVILQNRQLRGFPLRMTWEQVEQTSKVIDIDFFLVKHGLDSIGAALVFHITDTIVQVVYWGDLPQFSKYKTMNFLSYSIFNYYQKLGLKIVDIGPSTENSIPNYGLCEFKESLGCDIDIKTEFFKDL
jgi:hypothetical protein